MSGQILADSIVRVLHCKGRRVADLLMNLSAIILNSMPPNIKFLGSVLALFALGPPKRSESRPKKIQKSQGEKSDSICLIWNQSMDINGPRMGMELLSFWLEPEQLAVKPPGVAGGRHRAGRRRCYHAVESTSQQRHEGQIATMGSLGPQKMGETHSIQIHPNPRIYTLKVLSFPLV